MATGRGSAPGCGASRIVTSSRPDADGPALLDGDDDACVGQRERVQLLGDGGREPLRRRATSGRESFGGRVQDGRGVALVAAETRDALSVVVELGETERARSSQLECGFQAAVGTHDARHGGPALLDRGEFVGACIVQIRQVRAQLGGEISDPIRDVVEDRCMGGQHGVGADHPFQRATRLGDEQSHIGDVTAARQRIVGDGGRLAQFLDVRQSFGTLGELDVFARLRIDLLDLGKSSTQLLGFGSARLGVAGDLRDLGGELTLRGVGLPVLLQDGPDLRGAEAVERIALGSARTQPELIGLAVDDDELLGEFGEHARGRGAPADARAAASLRGDRAAQVQLGAPVTDRFDLSPGIRHAVSHGARLGDQPHALDGRLGCAGTDNAGVGARAEKQAEPGDDHRLAGTGLSGDGGEAGTHRKRRVSDDTEVPERHLLDHARPSAPIGRDAEVSSGPRHPVTGSWNFRTSRSVNGAGCRRARRTGCEDLRTTTRAPGGRS